MKWQWIVILVLLLFLVIFTVQNYEVIKIQFLFWSFQTSRAIIIFSTLFIGIIIGWIINKGTHYLIR
ncbi:MAG: lipopolysaccharide assembly protein LapA domain-containing protein [Candidatus Omnitrophota bacterium]|jgi:uncharacterized integral membrane protein